MVLLKQKNRVYIPVFLLKTGNPKINSIILQTIESLTIIKNRL